MRSGGDSRVDWRAVPMRDGRGAVNAVVAVMVDRRASVANFMILMLQARLYFVYVLFVCVGLCRILG